MPNRAAKNTEETGGPKSFYDTFKWIILVAQCFGLMPVENITTKNVKSLRFSWISLKTTYSILNCTGAAFLMCFYFYRIVKEGSNLFVFGTAVFYFNTFLVIIFFLKLAREWPSIVQEWIGVEMLISNYGFPCQLRLRLLLIVGITFGVAAAEYSIPKANDVLSAIKYKTGNQSVIESLYINILYGDLFSTVNYSHWSAFLLQFNNILLTFSWTFNDLFIIIVSTIIALQFKQICLHIEYLKAHPKTSTTIHWSKVRENYTKLSNFTKMMDDALSYIILTSFSSNLYSILMQLFNSLRNTGEGFIKIYFYLSFGFLIGRTSCVILYGAWINEESSKPLSILNTVSSDVYNFEVRRFIRQLEYDTVTLTGKKLFNISRGLILGIAGAIVTYELVLIQFNINLLR